MEIKFDLNQWGEVLKKADILTKQNSGHSFIKILKTKCKYCGRTEKQKGSYSQWHLTFFDKILEVLLTLNQTHNGK